MTALTSWADEITLAGKLLSSEDQLRTSLLARLDVGPHLLILLFGYLREGNQH